MRKREEIDRVVRALILDAPYGIYALDIMRCARLRAGATYPSLDRLIEAGLIHRGADDDGRIIYYRGSVTGLSHPRPLAR